MEEKRSSLAPVVVAVLLALPVLYVGSYMSLVVPEGIVKTATVRGGGTAIYHSDEHYRVSGSLRASAAWLFWPLEQVDRHWRPEPWDQSTTFIPVVG
jgi:hypothetical protein